MNVFFQYFGLINLGAAIGWPNSDIEEE